MYDFVVMMVVGLVNVSLVGLGDIEVLPWAGARLHTKMSTLPKGPVTKT